MQRKVDESRGMQLERQRSRRRSRLVEDIARASTEPVALSLPTTARPSVTPRSSNVSASISASISSAPVNNAPIINAPISNAAQPPEPAEPISITSPPGPTVASSGSSAPAAADNDDDLTALFAAIDQNGDGSVTRIELLRTLNSKSNEQGWALHEALRKTLGLPATVTT